MNQDPYFSSMGHISPEMFSPTRFANRGRPSFSSTNPQSPPNDTSNAENSGKSPSDTTSPFSPSNRHIMGTIPSQRDLYVTKLAPKYRFEGHDGCINALAYSSSGEFLLTGSDDATVRLWRSFESENDAEALNVLRGHRTNIFAVQFLNQTSHQIVSGGNDSDIRLYDVEGKTCKVFEHHQRKVLCIKENPTMPGTFLSCSADNTVRLFDIRCHYNATRVETLQECNSITNAGVGDSPSFLGENGVLPQSLGGGRSSQWNNEPSADSDLKDSLLQKLQGTAYTVDVHPNNGHDYVVSCEDGNTYLFDLRKRDSVDYAKSAKNIFCNAENRCDTTGASFDYSGRKVVTTCIRGNIYMYDTDKNFGETHNIDFLEWDVKNEEGIQTYEREFKGHSSIETIKGVWFWGPQSEYIISGSDDGSIFIWDRETGKILRILDGGHFNNVNNLAFHPSVPMFVSSGIDSFALSWEPSGATISDEELEKREKLIEEAEKREVNSPSDYEDGGAGQMMLLHLLMMMNRRGRVRLSAMDSDSDSADDMGLPGGRDADSSDDDMDASSIEGED